VFSPAAGKKTVFRAIAANYASVCKPIDGLGLRAEGSAGCRDDGIVSLVIAHPLDCFYLPFIEVLQDCQLLR
jgi:hypothetical protein